MAEFLDHYEEQERCQTYQEAIAAAKGETDRVWFVRHGDQDECAEEDIDHEEIWTVENPVGKYVNCVCFFVSTKPRRPEHVDTVFDY